VFPQGSPWQTTSETRNSGFYSAQTNTVDNDQQTTLEVTIECVSGNITFYRRVSCEHHWDYLSFSIDEVEKGKWSGEKDWAKASFPVSAGTRTFAWSYVKDSSVAVGEDAAWIDDIQFPIP